MEKYLCFNWSQTNLFKTNIYQTRQMFQNSWRFLPVVLVTWEHTEQSYCLSEKIRDSLQLGLLSDFLVAIPLARKIKDAYNAHFQANCWGVTSTQDLYTKTLLPSIEFFTVHNYSQWVSEGNFSPSTAGMVRTAHQRGVYVRESGLNCRVQVKSWTLNMHQRHLNASSHSCFRDWKVKQDSKVLKFMTSTQAQVL